MVKSSKGPAYSLAAFKVSFADAERPLMTGKALLSARASGYTLGMIDAAIEAMAAGHFFKTMPSHDGSGIMQDVYHVPAGDDLLYFKFRADRLTEFMVLSFKPKR